MSKKFIKGQIVSLCPCALTFTKIGHNYYRSHIVGNVKNELFGIILSYQYYLSDCIYLVFVLPNENHPGLMETLYISDKHLKQKYTPRIQSVQK